MLAQEIKSTGGPWAIYGGRFHSSAGHETSGQFATWITVSEGECSAEMHWTARTPAEVRRAAASLKRGGYSVRLLGKENWLFARRPLRGKRELVAETRRLEAIASSTAAIDDLPSRPVRTRRQRLSDSFPTASWEYLQTLIGWKWTWVAAERRGRPSFLPETSHWHALTWCSLLVHEDGEVHLDLGVQVFARGLRAELRVAELRRVTRTLVQRMEPAGYRALKFGRTGERPTLSMVCKPVSSLPQALRERHRLNRLVFGD